jgi:hypothetical protein
MCGNSGIGENLPFSRRSPSYFPESGCHVRRIPVPSKEEYNPTEVFSILMR